MSLINVILGRLFQLLSKRRHNAGPIPTKFSGVYESPEDDRDENYAKAEYQSEDLPDEIDFSAWVPPIKNQSTIGSCVSHAIITGIETIDLWKNGQWGSTPLSEMWHYWKVRHYDNTFPEDDGQYARDGMKIAKKFGTCPEIVYPYIIANYNKGPSMPKFAESIARFWRISDYERCYSNIGIKSALMDEQVILASFPIRSDFHKYKVGVANYNKRFKQAGGHAVLIVGYSDNKQAFKVVNSWGSTWGQKGFGWLSYDYISKAEWFDAFAFNLERK